MALRPARRSVRIADRFLTMDLSGQSMNDGVHTFTLIYFLASSGLFCMLLTWLSMTLAVPLHFFTARFWIPHHYGLREKFFHQPVNYSAMIQADEVIAVLVKQGDLLEYFLPEKISQQIVRIIN